MWTNMFLDNDDNFPKHTNHKYHQCWNIWFYIKCTHLSSNKLKTYICLNPYMEKDINSLFSEFINELEYKKLLHTLN